MSMSLKVVFLVKNGKVNNKKIIDKTDKMV